MSQAYKRLYLGVFVIAAIAVVDSSWRLRAELAEARVEQAGGEILNYVGTQLVGLPELCPKAGAMSHTLPLLDAAETSQILNLETGPVPKVGESKGAAASTQRTPTDTVLYRGDGRREAAVPKQHGSKFYVTGSILKNSVTVMAKDRLDVLVDLGLTIWSDQEWNEAKEHCGEKCPNGLFQEPAPWNWTPNAIPAVKCDSKAAPKEPPGMLFTPGDPGEPPTCWVCLEGYYFARGKVDGVPACARPEDIR